MKALNKHVHQRLSWFAKLNHYMVGVWCVMHIWWVDFFKGATTTCKDAITHDHVICFQVVCSIFFANYYKWFKDYSITMWYISLSTSSLMFTTLFILMSLMIVKSLWSKVVLLLIYVHGIIVEGSWWDMILKLDYYMQCASIRDYGELRLKLEPSPFKVRHLNGHI
jgi:hypothetical protein